MKRELLTLGYAALTMLIAPMPSATADNSAAQVTGSNIDSVLLSADTVGDILGTSLPVQEKAKNPASLVQLDKNPECAVLVDGPDTKFYGSNFNLFRASLFADSRDDPDYAVLQTVATFPDPQTPQTVLRNGLRPTSDCDQTVQITSENNVSIKLSAPKVTDSHATWHFSVLDKTGAPSGWGCYFETRAAENTILLAELCQRGNGGPGVTQIMDQLVGGLPS
jgi:hypothetical protein